jgi:hypothetical protein
MVNKQKAKAKKAKAAAAAAHSEAKEVKDSQPHDDLSENPVEVANAFIGVSHGDSEVKQAPPDDTELHLTITRIKRQKCSEVLTQPSGRVSSSGAKLKHDYTAVSPVLGTIELSPEDMNSRRLINGNIGIVTKLGDISPFPVMVWCGKKVSQGECRIIFASTEDTPLSAAVEGGDEKSPCVFVPVKSVLPAKKVILAHVPNAASSFLSESLKSLLISKIVSSNLIFVNGMRVSFSGQTG